MALQPPEEVREGCYDAVELHSYLSDLDAAPIFSMALSPEKILEVWADEKLIHQWVFATDQQGIACRITSPTRLQPYKNLNPRSNL